MTPALTVAHLEGDQFEVAVRRHRIRVDQPGSDGGTDTGPTPVELFVASLAACVAHYARRFLVRHDLPTEGLSVDADFEIATRPARVGEIIVRLGVPNGVPDERLPALHAVANHCTVHNTLEDPPAVVIDLVPAMGEAA